MEVGNENDAKGVVVVLIIFLEHTGRYAYVITMLRRNGYHVIMGDLPGQGQTSRANKVKSMTLIHIMKIY